VAVRPAVLEMLLGSNSVDLSFGVRQGIERLTASNIIGEFGTALFPRLVSVAMSASSKRQAEAVQGA